MSGEPRATRHELTVGLFVILGGLAGLATLFLLTDPALFRGRYVVRTVVQDAAGVPLDPSFAEQRNILLRCKGVFYSCNKGAEARRFNRMLIDAGLIKRL